MNAALVIGGGNGIGRECCLRLGATRVGVMVADLLAEAAEATAGSIVAAGGRAGTVVCDVTSAAQVEAAVALAAGRLGELDVVIATAGIPAAGYQSGAAEAGSVRGRLDEYLDWPLEDWERVQDVNLAGTFRVVRAAAAHWLKAGRGGSIVLVSSVAATSAAFGSAAYAASKAGVSSLTRSAARALAPDGIRVNAVAPGLIRTNMSETLVRNEAATQAVLSRVPMARFGTPAEVAEAAVFLAGAGASYITGAVLHVDGGITTG